VLLDITRRTRKQAVPSRWRRRSPPSAHESRQASSALKFSLRTTEFDSENARKRSIRAPTAKTAGAFHRFWLWLLRVLQKSPGILSATSKPH